MFCQHRLGHFWWWPLGKGPCYQTTSSSASTPSFHLEQLKDSQTLNDGLTNKIKLQIREKQVAFQKQGWIQQYEYKTGYPENRNSHRTGSQTHTICNNRSWHIHQGPKQLLLQVWHHGPFRDMQVFTRGLTVKTLLLFVDFTSTFNTITPETRNSLHSDCAPPYATGSWAF